MKLYQKNKPTFVSKTFDFVYLALLKCQFDNFLLAIFLYKFSLHDSDGKLKRNIAN